MGNQDKAVSRAKERTSTFERVASFIPGYRGYQQREKIRESDRLVREELYRRLRIAIRNLDQAYNSLVTTDNTNSSSVESVKRRTDKLAEGIRHAEYGYAALLDPVKIEREELLALVNFDSSLLTAVQEIVTGTDGLKKKLTAGKFDGESVSALGDSVDALSDLFTERKQHMQGLSEH